MLTDESINLAMNFLHVQFPLFDGLADSSIGKWNEFDIIRNTSSYIQILHAGSLHWICVANTSKEKVENQIHYLYDSLTPSKLLDDVVKQIAAYSFCRQDELLLEIEPVQQQLNGVDCGLFAIAFATSIAHGDDPATLVYDTDQLRPHHLRCFEQERMTRFPVVNRKRIFRCHQRTHAVELFCSCRKPWQKNAGKKFDMAQCKRCSEWYHRCCEKIPARVFEEKKTEWRCRGCLDNT